LFLGPQPKEGVQRRPHRSSREDGADVYDLLGGTGRSEPAEQQALITSALRTPDLAAA